MLEDFISANDLKAEIVSYAQPKHFCKCELFLSGDEPIIAIVPHKSKASLEKIKKVLNLSTLTSGAGIAAEEITGYEEKFMPPISIYGAKIIIESLLMEREHLFFEIGEEKFLKIPPQEIKESNEIFESGNIVK